MQVGLDFGTTNSSASIYDGKQVTLLPIDSANTNPQVMRTVLFMTRDGERFIGREAINRYTTANVGRKIEYEWRNFGEYEMLDQFGEVIKQTLGAMIDVNAPGRLFQSIKSHLRDVDFDYTTVIEGKNARGIDIQRQYQIEQLISIILRMLLERIHQITGESVTRMVIGRPVNYAENPHDHAVAVARMRHACELAGIKDFVFLPEPNAAALAYARTAVERQRALVFDFGGGTLDVTIIETDGRGGSRVLGNDGVPVGGDIMDRHIMMGTITPHFGARSTIGPNRMPFPGVLVEHLSEWQSIVELAHPRFQKIIDDVAYTSSQPDKVAQLRVLINQNYALPLYEAIERAKVALSSADQALVQMHVPGIDIDQVVERWNFERLIGPEVRKVAACVDRAVAAAGLTHKDVHVVLRTGGSSRIPVFVKMLTERFGEAAMVEMDPFTGVAQGLGIAAADDQLFAQLQASV
jgi:hypothetical chaperone protein